MSPAARTSRPQTRRSVRSHTSVRSPRPGEPQPVVRQLGDLGVARHDGPAARQLESETEHPTSPGGDGQALVQQPGRIVHVDLDGRGVPVGLSTCSIRSPRGVTPVVTTTPGTLVRNRSPGEQPSQIEQGGEERRVRRQLGGDHDGAAGPASTVTTQVRPATSVNSGSAGFEFSPTQPADAGLRHPFRPRRARPATGSTGWYRVRLTGAEPERVGQHGARPVLQVTLGQPATAAATAAGEVLDEPMLDGRVQHDPGAERDRTRQRRPDPADCGRRTGTRRSSSDRHSALRCPGRGAPPGRSTTSVMAALPRMVVLGHEGVRPETHGEVVALLVHVGQPAAFAAIGHESTPAVAAKVSPRLPSGRSGRPCRAAHR